GNHNVMVADCDNDGKQEIFTGASCIDDNGSLLWTSGDKHGDAMHVGDLIPDREGLEVFECHEDKPYGETCYDARTGKSLFHINGTKDTGRCAADNVWAGNKGAEFWGAADNNVYDKNGKKIGGTKPAQNAFIYWDGDLEREILDGTKISKMTAADTIKNIFSASDCGSNNGTKNNACISVDLFGDWREELILRTSDNTKLRVWCTTAATNVRLTTLMHDMQYRAQAACEQSCYNQPPHVSYYLGSDAPLPARPKVLLNNIPNKTEISDEPAVTTAPVVTQPIVTEPVVIEPGNNISDIADGEIYTFRNVGSGLYLDVEGGNAANNADIRQGGNAGKQNQFRAVSAGNGYYYLVSQLGDGSSFALDVNSKKTDDGTNIELYTFNKGDNQQFKIIKNSDGSYTILTKISNDASCIEIEGMSKETGANVQEWTVNGGSNQKFFIEIASVPAEPVASTTVTTIPVTTQTTTTTTAPVKEHENNVTIWGDADCDGQVKLNDAVLIMQAISNPDRFEVNGSDPSHITEQGKLNADVIGHGNGITPQDANTIQSYCLRIVKQLPVD
ncbi:MAG: cellulose 1,4-beta-cellobiosidase, partial [Ruminococcus sp.]|nr:cellulose 1,4-beta-cellobiosidase [Ruminococcus sp.]